MDFFKFREGMRYDFWQCVSTAVVLTLLFLFYLSLCSELSL
ncbi:MAG: hypothetical protein NZ455_05355 [Bacteroidia bacterium]|nr:hypothetical protein [Bacteroidia bacterium]MDW8346283.1 hypothetical protein [Bacteroidia bacterium]